MNLYYEQDSRQDAVLEVARSIMAGARTAPKARGIDNVVIALLKKDGIKEVSDKLKEMAHRDGVPDLFVRDAAEHQRQESVHG
jgi:uncharacterized ferredoxin-like protein